MEKLEFSTNWNNKLDCNCFSTIRLFDTRKHFKGNVFEVFLQKKTKGKALVLGTIITKLDKLTDYVTYLDTGYNKEETQAIFKKMFRRTNFEEQKIALSEI